MVKNKQLQKGFLEGAEDAYQQIIGFLNEKDKVTLTDNVLIMMTKNLLERVRTIQVLGNIEREESITILTRAFLELQVSLNFILNDNTENRAKSYYYNNKIQSLKNLVKMQRSDPKYDLKLNNKEMESLKKEVPTARSIEEFISYYENEWYKMFSPLKSKMQRKKPYKKWYSLNWEYKSFKDMMKSVNIDESIYHFYYGITSIDVHGMGAIGNIKISGSNYKITSSIPAYLCYAIIESYLSNIIYRLSEYYGMSKDKDQVSAFTKMANFSIFI